MAYLLDTDILIDYLAGQPEATALIDRLAPDGISLSIISYMEAYQGVLRSAQRAQAEAELEAFLAVAPLLPFSVVIAQRCAALREELRLQGKRVRARALDLLVAATALEHDLTLITRNRDDYADIARLQLYSP